MRILLVEDERKVASFVARALRENAYAVDSAGTGEDGLRLALENPYDAILLDVRLPGMSGIELCRKLRQAEIQSPILMLTARSLVEQRVEGLDAGADDYVVKPFGSEELMARIRATLRRAAPTESLPSFSSPDLSIDFGRRAVTVKGKPVRLTPKEFELLRFLIANQGKPMAHRRLLQAVWGPDYGEETEYLRVFINQLRKKIEPDPRHPRYIHTEPWLGYRFDPPEEKTRARADK